MEKTFEGFGDVIWHVNVDIFLIVIPVNGPYTSAIPFKVHVYVVIFLECLIDYQCRYWKIIRHQNCQRKGKSLFSSLYVARGL